METKGEVVRIEKLTEEERKMAEEMSVLALYVNGVWSFPCLVGLVAAFSVLLVGLGYLGVKEVLNPLRLTLYIYILFFAMGTAVISAFLSYFLYFKRKIHEKMERLRKLSKDPVFSMVLRKIRQFASISGDLKEMKELSERLNSRDAFMSSRLRKFLASIPT